MSRRKPGTRRPRKDRVLQARIPSDLDEQLRDRAEQLGLSVSTVVRNVLLHTFDLVEGVVADSSEIARVFHYRHTQSSRNSVEEDRGDAATVLGWQEAVLNQNGVCQQCNAILPRGSRVAIGLPIQTRPALLCLACLADISNDQPDPAA